MKEIKIINQKELDNLSEVKSDESVVIYLDGAEIFINRDIHVYGHIKIDGKINCKSNIYGYGNSTLNIDGWGNSTLNINGRENSTLNIYGYGNSTLNIDGRENSTLNIYGCGNSTLNIDGWGNSAIRLKQISCKIIISIAAFCCLWKPANLNISVCKKSEQSVVIDYYNLPYLEREGIEINGDNIILFKRVSADFKTQEGTKNETLWDIGSTVVHPKWHPGVEECGEGKFHACSKPYFCDEFRSNKDDVYIAIQVKIGDLHEWVDNPSYPHKIAFREGIVLYQCDKMGNEIKINKV